MSLHLNVSMAAALVADPARAAMLMEPSLVALLVLAGLAGGLMNAIAGGATLVTFPAMLAAGLPPIVANASSAIAVTPGHLVAAIADRESLPPVDRVLAACIVATTAGGLAGAALLLFTPEDVFTLLVPGLIGVATLIFALAPAIQRAAERGGRDAASPGARFGWVGASSVYGGYFGAGLGVMLLAILALTGREPLRTTIALKNLLSAANSLAIVSIFAIRGTASWPHVLTMLIGTIVGGFIGARLLRIVPAEIIRTVVVVIGAAMTAIYAYRYWL